MCSTVSMNVWPAEVAFHELAASVATNYISAWRSCMSGISEQLDLQLDHAGTAQPPYYKQKGRPAAAHVSSQLQPGVGSTCSWLPAPASNADLYCNYSTASRGHTPVWGVPSLFYAAAHDPAGLTLPGGRGANISSARSCYTFDELGMREIPLAGTEQLAVEIAHESIRPAAAHDLVLKSSSTAFYAAPTKKLMKKIPVGGAVIRRPPSSSASSCKGEQLSKSSPTLPIDNVFDISASRWLKANIICNSSFLASELDVKSERTSELPQATSPQAANYCIGFNDAAPGVDHRDLTLNDILLGSLLEAMHHPL